MRTTTSFTSFFSDPLVGSKTGNTILSIRACDAALLRSPSAAFPPITLLDAFRDGSMLGAHTGCPRRWIGGSLVILLALFGRMLLERLFLTPDPCASLKFGFEEICFFSFNSLRRAMGKAMGSDVH